MGMRWKLFALLISYAEAANFVPTIHGQGDMCPECSDDVALPYVDPKKNQVTVRTTK